MRMSDQAYPSRGPPEPQSKKDTDGERTYTTKSSVCDDVVDLLSGVGCFVAVRSVLSETGTALKKHGKGLKFEDKEKRGERQMKYLRIHNVPVKHIEFHTSKGIDHLLD